MKKAKKACVLASVLPLLFGGFVFVLVCVTEVAAEAAASRLASGGQDSLFGFHAFALRCCVRLLVGLVLVCLVLVRVFRLCACDASLSGRCSGQ
jgi:hypothetical protein